MLTLIILTSTSWAFFEDGNYSSGTGIESVPADYDGEITITEVNTWSVPEGTSAALGLDYIPFWYTDHVIAYVCAGDKVYFMSADNGSVVHSGGWSLDGNNSYPFGVCYVPYSGDERLHVNDFVYDAMFSKYYATPWVEYNSLTDLMGRGLDYHAGMDKIFDFYTSGTSGSYQWYVAMFSPGQSTGPTYQLDCVIGTADWYGSGCCVHPMSNGNIGIAVTMYDSQWIRFFEYPGHAGEAFYSHGVFPYTVDTSYGLTYADERNTFFHSYKIGSSYYISELEISEASLESDTWAGIKSRF